MDWIRKIVFAPLSLLYGIGVSLRNFFYSKELLKGVEFDIPVIAVGNLSMGGAGKTPHVEYLIRLLKDYVNLATLSRGYKRKTKGFRLANQADDVRTIGDEPLQFYQKFPDIYVAVSENRMLAIPQLVSSLPDLQTILLDDAYQHRSVKPGLNILLTQYQMPFTKDWLLPSGNLREWRSAYRRADIIIVSKCPDFISDKEKEEWRREIQPLPHQSLFFSKYEYQAPYAIFKKENELSFSKDMNVLLLCALASSDYLVDYLETQAKRVRRLEFEDHHFFTKYDIGRLEDIYTKWEESNKIIITTQKDATRLEEHKDFIQKHNLPIFVLPTEVRFLADDSDEFDEYIRRFLLDFKA